MIRALVDGPDCKLMIVGLTAPNIDRLRKGEPIFASGESFGNPGTDLFILYGDSPGEVIAELQAKGFDLPTDPDKIHIERIKG